MLLPKKELSHYKKSYAKNNIYLLLADHKDDNTSCKLENRQTADGGQLHHNRDAAS